MAEYIQVGKSGKFVFEVPKEASESLLLPQLSNVKTDKEEVGIQEISKKKEEQPFIYQLNDPFLSLIGQAQAIGSISNNHKPWVKKTWITVFLIMPLIVVVEELLAIDGHISDHEDFLALLVSILYWSVYYAIWQNKVAKKKASAAQQKPDDMNNRATSRVSSDKLGYIPNAVWLI